MPLRATLNLQLRMLFTKTTSGGSTPTDDYYFNKLLKLLEGTGAAQVDRGYHDIHSIAAGANLDLDLSGTLVDALGQTLTASKIKCMLLYNLSGISGNELVCGGAPANAWEGWTPVAGSKFYLFSASAHLLWCPNTDAPAVTGGTGDIFRINNPNAGSVDVEVAIAGV